jgi:hypothetical protein
MGTTIKSTSLDFDAIKNNLKTFLEQGGEFDDYNFEASGLSSILDVLAYNTHYNGLIANFALNESFLGTAQLRGSVISLAEGIGYIPDSKTTSKAVVNLSMNLSGLATRPNKISINDGFKFNATVDEVEYVFQTLEDISATDDGNGLYLFTNVDGSQNITIHEGIARTKTFLALDATENANYIIPDESLDLDTVVVRVYETSTSSNFQTYTNIVDAVNINENSTLFILKEAPNGLFELSFGNGKTLGRAPAAGNKVTVDYLAVSGSDADTSSTFAPQSKVTVEGQQFNINVTTVTKAVGGGSKESIESIRKNAPFQYASQNRMVTAVDYSTLALRNFSTLIKDIKSFGGEDALEPEFGTVFMSVLFNDDVDATTIQSTKDAIQDLAKQLSVASFSLKFDDPVKTFIETRIFFQFNPNLTTLSRNTIQDNVNTVIGNYFAANTGKFSQSFRRSNLLTLVDDISPAILSSRSDVFFQRRFTPTLNTLQDHKLRYAAIIADPDDKEHIITSSAFTLNNKTCILRNKLDSSKLEVFNTIDREVLVDNIGNYSDDTISIVGLKVDDFVGANQFIKVSAKPANQSAITPFRQDIIEFDTDESFSRIVDVEPGVTN